MTEIISRNEFDKSYLLIRKEIPENNYIFNMITQNNIPGIPECKIRYLDDNAYFAYEVTGKKTLVKLYEDRKMKFEDLTELFYDIRNIMHYANEYLLDRNGFLLQPMYMFTDLETGELSCLYHMPEEDKEKEERYRALADFLLDKIDHKDEHAVNIAYYFYKISKEEYFSFESFIGFMEKECLLVQEENRKKERLTEKEPSEQVINEITMEDTLPEIGKKQVSIWGEIGIIFGLFFVGIGLTVGYLKIPFLKEYMVYILVPGITISIVAVIMVVRSIIEWYKEKSTDKYEEPTAPVRVEDYFEDMADDVTVFFDQDEYLTLKWKEAHFSKEYILEEFPVTVGKKQSSVQMIIEDVSVSRLHARFRKQGNSVYLQDLDSTNGTYVNEERISVGEERIIKRGDEIQFGKIIVNVV